MGVAGLDYKKGGFDINGIIKDYYVYAGENISAGDFVEFINGVSGETEISTTTTTKQQLFGEDYGRNKVACRLTDTKVFLLYTKYSSNSNYPLYAVILTINNGVITVGSSVTIGTGYCGRNISAVTLSETSVAVAYGYSSTLYLRACVCTINGTSISTGGSYTVHSGEHSSSSLSMCLVTSGKICILYRYNDDVTNEDVTTYYIYSKIGTISGTTILFGTQATLYSSEYVASSNASYGTAVVAVTDDKVMYLYHNPANYTTGLFGRIGTISNKSITLGTQTTISSTSYLYGNANAITLTNGSIVITHRHSGNMYATACTVSGTTISKGTTKTLSNKNAYYSSISEISNNRVAVFYTYDSSLRSAILSVSVRTITVGTEFVVDSDSTGNYLSSATLSLDNVIITNQGGSSETLNGQVLGFSGSVPSNTIQIEVPKYETQVRKTTSQTFNGVAKTKGEGGNSAGHKDIVNVYVVDFSEFSIITNGDFENNMDGWHSWDSDVTFEKDATQGYIGNCCAKFSFTRTYSANFNTYTNYTFDTIKSHKYYVSCYYKCESANNGLAQPRMAIYDVSTAQNVSALVAQDGNATSWTKMSMLVSGYATGESYLKVGMLVSLVNNAETTASITVYYDTIRLYDLTEMFGAGNEPTKEWCDANL